MTSSNPTNALVTTSGATALEQASPASLDELFSRDPLELGETDIETICQTLRDARAKWQAAEASGTTRSASTKAPKVAAPKTLSLNDLGL